MSFARTDRDDLMLAVRLTPKSAADKATGIWTDAAGAQWLGISVRAVPEKGKANQALVNLLASQLKLPKGTISLESGETNRLKRLRIRGAADDAARITAELVDWT